MRKPDDLTREQLILLVDGMQQQLYLDVDSEGRARWNPDKEWKGADVCNQIAQLLSEQDLVPDRLVSYEADASAAT